MILSSNHVRKEEGGTKARHSRIQDVTKPLVGDEFVVTMHDVWKKQDEELLLGKQRHMSLVGKGMVLVLCW